MGIPLLVLAAVTVHFTDVYRAAPSGDLSILHHAISYAPPTSSPLGVPSSLVYGLFVPVLLLCASMPVLRRRWHVTRGELIVVFCMLFLAVPVLGSGFWHQFPGALVEYTRTQRLEHTMSISPRLWPNRGNLLTGAGIEDEPVAWARWTMPDGAVIVDCPDGPGRCARIVHDSARQKSVLTLELDRGSSPRFVRPAVRYALCARLRLDDPGAFAEARLTAGTDARMLDVAYLTDHARPKLLAPDRFHFVGRINYQVPRELGDRFLVQLRFGGRGTLYARDFRIVETEQVFRLFEGYVEADAGTFAAMDAADRAEVLSRPEGWSKWLHFMIGRVPWAHWARPLAAWSLLVVGTFLAMYCLVAIFYRHWERGERLTFPLQTFLLDLTSGDDQGRLQVLRSRPFWIGLGASALYLSLIHMNARYPDIPAFQLKLSLPDLVPAGPLKDAAQSAHRSLQIDIRPAAVAVAFLMSLEMSLSLVAFFAIAVVYKLVGYMTPLQTVRLAYVAPRFPFDLPLMVGGLLFMAVFCVASARKHLAAVVRRVLARPDADADEGEAMSYRWATGGVVIAFAMIACFAVVAGINPVFVTLYVFVFLMLALSAARIRAETGLPHLALLPLHPHLMLVALGGAMVLGFRQVSLVGQASFLYLGSFLMTAPILAESIAAAERAEVPLRKLTRCLFAALAIALVVGGVIYLSWAYAVGSSNMHTAVSNTHWQYRSTMYVHERSDELIGQHFRDHPDEPRILTPQKRREIAPTPLSVWGIAGLSFIVTALLALARVIWLGFPLHPLGFALAFTPAMNALWSSIAVGHLVKRLGLRYGGVQLSRAVLRPFFVGLFVGDMMTAAAWRGLEALYP